MKKIGLLFFSVMVLLTIFVTVGSGSDNTIQTCIIANEKYSKKADLEAKKQPENLVTHKPVYAGIQFIETPKGTAYTVKWYLNDTKIKTETKTTKDDRQSIVVYDLEAKKAVKGNLKMKVYDKDKVLITKEISIK